MAFTMKKANKIRQLNYDIYLDIYIHFHILISKLYPVSKNKILYADGFAKQNHVINNTQI